MRWVTANQGFSEVFTSDGAPLVPRICQDFTHLMLGMLRLRGIPCRYVSGYLHVERESAEASQSHAWIEFFSPSAGWIAFDPTHDDVADERYVAPKAIAALHEEVEQIDLPVFQEIPARVHDRIGAIVGDAAAQLQQQQAG